MYCMNCGNYIDDSAAFCSTCGAPNCGAGMMMPVATAPDPVEQEKSNEILRWGIMGLAFSLNIPILGIIFSNIGRKKAREYQEIFGAWTGKTKVGAILAKAGIIAGWCMLGFLVFMILYYGMVFSLIAAID